MNSLFELIKVDLRETLDLRKFKENKTRSISFISFIILMGSLFVLLSTYISYNMVSLYDYANISLVYPFIMASAIASILCFSTSIFKVKSIFVGKDYDLLRSMPIRKGYIIASKLVSLYLIELLYAAIIAIPNFILCFSYSNDFSFIWMGIIVTILIPAVPIILAALFSLFISLVADRYRFGGVINILLYLLLLVGIFFISFTTSYSSSSSEELDISSLINMAKNISWINPTLYFVKDAYTSNILYFIVFIAINIIALIIAISFIALLYDKVYHLINSFKADYKYKRKKLGVEGQLKALFIHEIKRFLKSKYYMLNSMSSGICALIFAGMLGYLLSPWSGMLESADLEKIRSIAFVGTLFIIFGIGISTPASCSISIEGSSFWVLKTNPIEYKTMAKAKILASISILGTCSLLSSLIMIVMIQPTIFSSVLIVLIPFIFVVLSSILGLTINLSFPKLKWKNEQECVKMSACIVITMLLDWLITILVGVSLIGLLFVNIYLSGILTLSLLIIAAILAYLYTIKTVNKKMNKIEEF